MSFFKTVIAKMRRKPSCSKLSEILLSCSNSEIRFCFRSDKNKNKYFDCCTTAKEATEICRILGNINLCCPEKDKNFIKYIPVMHKYGFALEFICPDNCPIRHYSRRRAGDSLSGTPEFALLHSQNRTSME